MTLAACIADAEQAGCLSMKPARWLLTVCLLVITASAGVSAYALLRASDRENTAACVARASAEQATDSNPWGNTDGRNPFLEEDFVAAKQRAIDAC
ncbi:MAG: hypothetical protein M3Q75_08450 [Gemmatimonadota bacterium]|nr:hypothetical protein [Gemmatimonadota bacterium]